MGKIKSIDEFDEIYTANMDVKSTVFDDEGQAGQLETYGDDAALVHKIHKKTPKKVWTCIDGDDCGMYMVAGYHFVNRVYYFISNESWKSENEEYQILEG